MPHQLTCNKRQTAIGRSKKMAATLLCFSHILPNTQAFVRNSAAKSRAFGCLSKSPPLEKTLPTLRLNFPVRLQSTVEKVSAYDALNKERGLESYTPQEFEGKIYKWWEDSGCFEPDAKQNPTENQKQPYVLPMPPPNVTGRLHMGHAIFVALQDVLARFHRMRGRPVLWLPGT
jgi:tRNA synthetases class I (I, L, M and V)